MHLFRLRYTALGLLTFLQLVTSCASSCVFTYDEHEQTIISRTLVSTIVFEGLAHREYPYKDGQYKVKFKVLRMAKGGLPRESSSSNRYRSVLVGEFGDASDAKRCVASRGFIKRSQKYLVFLNTTVEPRKSRPRVIDRRKSSVSDFVNSAQKSHFSGDDRIRAATFIDEMQQQQQQPYNFTYYLASFPYASNDKWFDLAVRNNCTSCVRKPNITKISPDRHVSSGKKVKFICRTIGYPTPEVIWLKNGNMLDEEQGKITMRMKNQTSILQIKKISIEDSGSYQCQAFNFVGRSNMSRTRLFVSSDNENVFQQRCQRQTYCLNGGTCFELSKNLGKNYCECDGDYVGERCEQKNIGFNLIIRKKKKVPTATLR